MNDQTPQPVFNFHDQSSYNPNAQSVNYTYNIQHADFHKDITENDDKKNRSTTDSFEEKEKSKEADPLRKYLPKREDYEYVLEWAPLCHSPKDIYNNIVMPLKRKGYDISITTNIPFLTALIPYLSNYTSSKSADSISRALRK